MSTKKLHTDKGNDGQPHHKGQPSQMHQKGGPAISKRDAHGGKHEKDESSGAEKNTTKKQQNAI
jgi:hypothetical protein